MLSLPGKSLYWGDNGLTCLGSERTGHFAANAAQFANIMSCRDRDLASSLRSNVRATSHSYTCGVASCLCQLQRGRSYRTTELVQQTTVGR